MSNIFLNADDWRDQDGNSPPIGWTGSQYEMLESDPVVGGATFELTHQGIVQAGDTLRFTVDVASFTPRGGYTGYFNVVYDANVVFSRQLTSALQFEVDLVGLVEGANYRIIISDSSGGSGYSTMGFYEFQAVLVPMADADELIANDDSATTPFETPVDVPVLDNDVLNGVSPVPSDAVVTTIETAPDNGVAVVNPDGTITYTPNAGFHGTDTFVYRITRSGEQARFCGILTEGGSTIFWHPALDPMLPLEVTTGAGTGSYTYSWDEGQWYQVEVQPSPSDGDTITVTQGSTTLTGTWHVGGFVMFVGDDEAYPWYWNSPWGDLPMTFVVGEQTYTADDTEAGLGWEPEAPPYNEPFQPPVFATILDGDNNEYCGAIFNRTVPCAAFSCDMLAPPYSFGAAPEWFDPGQPYTLDGIWGSYWRVDYADGAVVSVEGNPPVAPGVEQVTVRQEVSSVELSFTAKTCFACG